MARKIVTDMVLSKKSIRQIPISAEKEREIKRGIPANRRRKPLNPRFIIWLIAIICLLAVFFGISMLFSSATITITPRQTAITFDNESYVAKQNSTSSTELSFEVLKVSQNSQETVMATEEKNVTEKASGQIVIYNNYSSASQRLINNTRFEAKNGKVYRINSSVIVPGYKKINGQLVPGSVEVKVFADQAGDNYNLALADLVGDFNIPGFKGDPRYAGFYARLKTDITGGFIGKQRIVSDSLRNSTKVVLKERLREELLKKLYAVIPADYLVFKDSYTVDYIDLPDTAIGTDKVALNIKGDLNGIIFNNLLLTKYLAEKKISNFDGLPAELIPTDNFVATLTGKDSANLWKNNVLQVKLDGDALVKWLYKADDIKKDLAGKKEADIKGLLNKYKDSILSIGVSFTPIWTRYIPENVKKISIREAAL